MLLQAQGDLAGAAPLYRETLQMSRETLGDRHPDTLISICNLGTLLRAQGDLAGAAALYREALQVSRDTLGSHHPHTLISMGHLRSLLKMQGETVEATALLHELSTARGGAATRGTTSFIRSQLYMLVCWLRALLPSARGRF